MPRRLKHCAVAKLAHGSVLTLALLASGRAGAQGTKPVPGVPAQPVPDEAAAKKPPPTDPREIVVFGGSTLTAALNDVVAEQVYDPDRVNSYGVSSIGELLDAITGENGDDAPQILINGQPVRNINDISDLPIEAVARIEQLPRGSAVAVGGTPGQRAYNVVLRSSVNTRTATMTYQVPTAGGWDNVRADGQITYIKNDDRINLSLRGGRSGSLLERERGVIPLALSAPYSPLGNVFSTAPDGIDPALNALAGQIVSVAGIPGVTNPTLANFVTTAGRPNSTDVTGYRSLRGRSRPYDFALSGNKVLAPWLSLSFNGRLGWTNDQRLSGLASARFLLPAEHPNSPFSRDVVLLYSDAVRPLHSDSTGENVSMALTLNATWGDWRATLAGKYDDRSRISNYDAVGSILGGQITVPTATNPFGGTLASLIPVTTTRTWSDNATQDLQADLEGPLFKLPAGQVRLRAGLGATWLQLDGASSSGLGERHFRRHQYSASGGLTMPLTGNVDGSFGGFGQSDFTVDASVSDLGPYGSIDSLALALNWQPRAWLRFSASQTYEEVAGAPEILAAPITTTPNVPYFDPVTGNTDTVTLISGGGGNLDNESRRTRHVSVTATPWKKYNLQLSSDFIVTDVNNQAGALPLPTPDIIAAFPDRFTRDPLTNRLTQVDSRTVNFARQHTSELRTAFGITLPLSHPVAKIRVRGVKYKAPPRPVLQINASLTHVFVSTSTIREVLGPVDLLAGGGVGLFGGRSRDNAEASVALSDRGIGLRAQMAWHGPSYLATGTPTAPDRLTFAPYARFDLKVFADLAQLFGRSVLTKGARVTVGIENVGNTRQQVRNQAGITPLGYQSVYRDPLGRMVTIELRKVF
jgi:iron complex outermembrane recepter protein